MATNPLFVANMDTLKSKLRLSGLPSDGDGESLLEEALLVVREGFYRRLTATGVSSILATGESDNPTTHAQILRSVASSTEVKWVRLQIIRSMPTLTMDGSGRRLQVWNEEAAFRQQGQSERENEIRRMEKEVEENLELLAGTESIGSETTFHITTLEPDDTPPRPGGSIRINTETETY